jgi:protein phosphatase
VALFDWYTMSEQAGLPHNEDCVLAEPGYGIFIVADGMGGRPGGAQASRVAARAFMEFLRRVNPSVLTETRVLRSAVAAANEAVRAVVQADPNMAGMGTTLSAVILTERRNKIVHVGDSRIYGYVQGKLELLTEDHTLSSELVARQIVSDKNIGKLPLRNVLSQAVGTKPAVEPDIADLVLLPEEWLLLTTDGLYKTLSDARLAETMMAAEKEGAQAMCRSLMRAALAAQPRDNVTLAIVRRIVADSYR